MSSFRTDAITFQAATNVPRPGDSPAKIKEAAQQFEALLIGQLLQSAAESGGWLGSGSDSASSCAGGFAQQQLAGAMSKSGGFGLAALIEEGLKRQR